MDTKKLGLTVPVVGSLYTHRPFVNQPDEDPGLGDAMSLDKTALQGFNVISHSLIPNPISLVIHNFVDVFAIPAHNTFTELGKFSNVVIFNVGL